MVCTPATFSSGPRSRSITSSDDMPRSDSGFRLSVRLPRLIELQPFDTPTVEPTLATAGSASITSTTARCRSSIAWNETSGEASVEPIRMPVSCSGRKPFGSTVYSRTVSTMVASVTSSMNTRCSSAQPSVTGVESLHGGEAAFQRAIEPRGESCRAAARARSPRM